MSFLESVKHALIVEDPASHAQAAQPADKKGTMFEHRIEMESKYPVGPVSEDALLPAGQSSDGSDSFIRTLRPKISANSSEIEKFAGIVESLIDVPEAVRLKAALSVGKTLNISREQLIAAYDQRGKALDGEVAKFRAQLDGEAQSQTASMSAEISQLESSIQAKSRELSALTSQRDASAKRISTMRFKREMVERDFNAAAESLRTELQTGSTRLREA